MFYPQKLAIFRRTLFIFLFCWYRLSICFERFADRHLAISRYEDRCLWRMNLADDEHIYAGMDENKIFRGLHHT